MSAAGVLLNSWEAATSEYLDGNQQYNPAFIRATWDDARDAIEVERDRVTHARRVAATHEGFDDEVDGELEDWQVETLWGIDVGVAGVTFALAAAGCVTTTSCRGHPGYASPDRDFPRVRFYADAARARIVRDVAVASGCGFDFEPGEPAEIWAPSVTNMIAAAQRLLDLRATFEALPPQRFK